MEFQQSKTYSNLQSAFHYELNASTLFSISGDRARQEGYQEIGSIYDIVQGNAKEHARIWMRRLNNGTLPNTSDLLRSDSEMEKNAGNDMYREYAKTAREEGFDDIAALFNGVANIDLNHSLQLRTQYEYVVRGEVFCKQQERLWICMQCGNIMFGLCAPVICPVCGFPQGYYRPYSENE